MKGFVEANFTKVTLDLLDQNRHQEKCTDMVKLATLSWGRAEVRTWNTGYIWVLLLSSFCQT